MSFVFWASAVLVFTAYAGYALLVLVLAAVRPKPLARVPVTQPPTVTAILCVHDAQGALTGKLRNLLALDHPVDRFDVIVACDGCSDGMAQACRDIGDARIRVLEFGQRRGKAACLNDAVAKARGDVLLMVDVRQRIERNALRRLLECLSDPGVGAASGELCFESPDAGFARSVDAYWRYEKLIRQAESRSGSVVGVTGALYVMRRSLFKPIPPGTVLDDVLLPMQVIAAGFRVVFEPGALAWDRASQSPGQERKRKVRTLAGNLQLLAIAPWLLDPRANPAWIRFTCHKLLRLAAPWLLCALLVSTLLLAPRHPFYFACACAAAVAALALLVGSAVPRLSGTWPVRLLSAFWHMNLYAAQALVAYVRNPRLHLW